MGNKGQQSGSQHNKGQSPTGQQHLPGSSSTRPDWDMGHQGQETAASAAEKAKETASGVGERLRDAASSAAGSVQDMARKAQDIASDVGQRAGETVSNVGGQMRNLADTIRQSAPSEGVLSSAASTVADSLDTGGRYLEEETLSNLGREATDLIRRYPLQAVLVGIGIGFLMARATPS
jgi:ElaB/YqjD/DUF883 family membrane-anchored ribosome-binding protein